MTALHHAIEENSEELVGFLLDNGADPTLTNDLIGENNTPFHAAISRGKTAIASLLLETGKFDVNVAGAEGWGAAHPSAVPVASASNASTAPMVSPSAAFPSLFSCRC